MIHKLSTEVINKIAAGQVVQRPYNALKQLIENSIDAGATTIHILVQNGGMKKLQIKDNGRGIPIEDYPLLCERYATSKITTITDLQSISSYGFRGQALASLTHVGDVQVISRHSSSKQGYYARFENQHLVGQPKQVKREVGTTITVENLFETLVSRRKSLAPNQEKKLIKQLIFQMALDCPHIEFTMSTEKGQELLIDYKEYSQDEARMKIFCQLTSILKQSCLTASTTLYDTKITGIFSRINTWDKWRNIIVTINHRIVDSPEVEKVIQKAYDEANRTIHKESYSYCCYLNILIEPHKIDCNIHPTKKQVTFYKSADLFFAMLKWMEKLLQDSGTIKFLDTGCKMSQHSLMELQARYNQKVVYSQFSQENNNNNRVGESQLMGTPTQNRLSFGQKTDYAFNKTRTDSKQLPLQYFYKNLVLGSSSQQRERVYLEEQSESKPFTYKSFLDFYVQNGKVRQVPQLKQFFLSVTYVGCFNSSHAFIQLENKLFCFEISHFAKVYVREFLKQKRLLYLKRTASSQNTNTISVPDILASFLSKHQTVIDRQKLQRIYKTTLEQLNFNRDLLEQKYGIEVNEFLQLQAYPIVDKVFDQQPLRAQPLAYFLMQLFATSELQFKEDLNKLYIEFLASPLFALQQPQEQRFELSPYTDKYDNFFVNEFIPTLKMKGKFYLEEFQQINLPDLLSEMMDLKDAYKMFQRC